MQTQINYNQPALITYKHKKSTGFFKLFFILCFVVLTVFAAINASSLISGKSIFSGDASIFASIFGSQNKFETINKLEYGFLPSSVEKSEDGTITLSCTDESVVKITFACKVTKIGVTENQKYVIVQAGDTKVVYTGFKVLGVTANRTLKEGYILGLTNENSTLKIQIYSKNNKVTTFTDIQNGVSW